MAHHARRSPKIANALWRNSVSIRTDMGMRWLNRSCPWISAVSRQSDRSVCRRQGAGEQRRAGHRRVEHELMKFRIGGSLRKSMARPVLRRGFPPGRYGRASTRMPWDCRVWTSLEYRDAAVLHTALFSFQPHPDHEMPSSTVARSYRRRAPWRN